MQPSIFGMPLSSAAVVFVEAKLADHFGGRADADTHAVGVEHIDHRLQVVQKHDLKPAKVLLSKIAHLLSGISKKMSTDSSFLTMYPSRPAFAPP